jgi:hypothetical protein
LTPEVPDIVLQGRQIKQNRIVCGFEPSVAIKPTPQKMWSVDSLTNQ